MTVGALALAIGAVGPTAASAAHRTQTHAGASSPSSASSPSGEAMPTGNPTGWKQTFADEFTGPLGEEWSEYWGQPGSDPGGWWDPSHVSVSGGELRLATYVDPLTCIASWGCESIDGYVSGGVQLKEPQTYGKYEVRLRADNGQGVPIVALLWPSDGEWPPEVDFVEDTGASPRATNVATLHYGTLGTASFGQASDSLSVNMSEWHTLGVEWTSGKLAYTIDGRVWATMTGANVPHQPMNLALQSQTWDCGGEWETCPGAATPKEVSYDVDWVAIYTPA
ncbi:MAG TPA: glycoside hydrolase family 16 protein [Solirubrobacteraceae bacterium]|nr:glycoside hydrolase family 16 protein [Solirubrobacteraceae bacterium]